MIRRLSLRGYFTIETREIVWLWPWTEKVADGTRSLRFACGPFYFGVSVQTR